ncbi:MAG: ABC transporter ATP-binding protein [Geminicoccaceae bacterium]
MISLESVSKRYGAKTIIHDLSFSVEKGEIVGFLGPNGAGKTTTIRMIAGYTTATEGRVTVAGHDMATDQMKAAGLIGYLPERPPLYDNLNVQSYLHFVAKIKGVARSEMNDELERVTDACKLRDVFRKEIFKLSKGYRQRLGLAQALLGKPEVLLLDEPTIGLDPSQIQETRDVIRTSGEQHAVLISTHILPEVTLICRRVAIINHGRLLAIDTPEGLKQAVEQSMIVSLRVIGEKTPIEEALLSVDGVSAVQIEKTAADDREFTIDCRVDNRVGIEAAIARAVAHHFELLHLERRQPTLENVFLHYVRDRPASEAA